LSQRRSAFRTIALLTFLTLLPLGPLRPAHAGTAPNKLDDNRGIIGRVLANAEIRNLYWDSNWDANNPEFTRDMIDDFTQKLVDSNYLSWAGQYGVGSASFKGRHNPVIQCPMIRHTSGRSTNSAFLQAWIHCMVEAPFTGVPYPNINTLYVIYLPKGLTVDNGPLPGACNNWWAYHAWDVSTFRSDPPFAVPLSYPYAIIPAECARTRFARLMEHATHEIIEGITDVNVPFGWIDLSQLGFNFNIFTRGEAADICNPKSARLGSISVSKYWSNADGACVPFTLPEAPVITSVTAGDRSITVNWLAPDDTGGAPILEYELSVNPGPLTFRLPGSTTQTVNGLSNGTTYTVTVRARNRVGWGPLSAARTVTPVSVPSAPLAPFATAGDGWATVRWAPPFLNGGSPISQYTITSQPTSSTVIVGGDVTRVFVLGLTNGTAYTFTVQAWNRVGPGRLSAPSNSVVPRAAPEIIEYPIPSVDTKPLGIATAADGNLWFTESNANRIGRITPAGVVTEFVLAPGLSRTLAVTKGPDGNIWFSGEDAATGASKIGRITPMGTTTTFAIPTQLAGGNAVLGIAAGPDGNIWFTEQRANKIGRFNPGQSTFTEFALSSGPFIELRDIAAGPDGKLWFTQWFLLTGIQGKIGRISTDGTLGTLVPAGAFSFPDRITAHSDGNLWFTKRDSNRIGRITPSGAITEFSLGHLGTNGGIASGPDGSIWFTETDDLPRGVVGTSDGFAEFGLPTSASKPMGITAGPDSNIWFTELQSNRIGRIRLVPSAPRNLTAVASNASAIVSWDPPASSGTKPVTGYEVTSNPGGITVVTSGATTTNARVGGLTNGVAYAFTARARNAAGLGVPSAASNSVVPHAVVPSEPRDVKALRGNSSAKVSWAPPASDGGASLQGYTITAQRVPEGRPVTVEVKANTLMAEIPGLGNGQEYAVTVAAFNAVGKGRASAAVTVIPATVPGPPGEVVALGGNALATVHWREPIDNGGSKIRAYAITTSPGNRRLEVGADARDASVSGLTNGTTYSVTVAAVNDVGTGAATASNPVTVGLPGQPRQVVARAGNSKATVEWDEPPANGGAITQYIVTASPGGKTVTNTGARTAVVTGLTNGTIYTFTVQAVNKFGKSSPSLPSNAVVPTAPTALGFKAGPSSGYTQEDLAVEAVLIDADSRAGLGGKPVRFALGTQSATVTTDANGAAKTALRLERAGAYMLQASFAGEAGLAPATATKDFTVRKRPTRLEYTGPTSGTRGAAVTLSAQLTDTRSGRGVVGLSVAFTLAGQTTTVLTDANGVAATDVVLNFEPGSLTLAVNSGSFWDDVRDRPPESRVTFELEWEALFVDAQGQGLIFLNPSTQEFQFMTAAAQTGIKKDPNMLVFPNLMVLSFFEDEEVVLIGAFVLDTGEFAALVIFDGTVYQLWAPTDPTAGAERPG